MKLSPLSIPYRVVQRGASVAVTLLFLLATGSSMVGGVAGALVGVGLIGLGLLLLAGYEVAHWRRYEYELTADTFDIRSGVFARREREIPLGRIQNVDIRRNVVQRAIGIAALDLETAGGGGTEAAIRYVPFREAKRLQREIADRKRGDAGAAPDAARRDDEGELLFELSTRELALVGALSFDLRLPGLLLFLLSGSATAVPSLLGVPTAGALALAAVGLVAVLAIVVVSWAVGAAVAVLNYYGFRLTRVDDELQYERGLLRRYDGSIPLAKVQTLTVEDNPLKRRFGYASLFIETAGRVGGRSNGGTGGSQAAVPIARVERVGDLAREIEAFGEPDLERPPGRVRRRYLARYLLGTGALVGLLYGIEVALGTGLPVPWYAPLLFLPPLALAAHLKWVHRGYWLGEDHLVTRNGVLSRETKVVPYYRIQTVIDSRTLFQRRWRLGTVTADTAGSLSLTGSDAAAVDVDRETADWIREELTDRLRRALAEYGRDRGWRWGDVAAVEGDDGSAPDGAVGRDETDEKDRKDGADGAGTVGARDDGPE